MMFVEVRINLSTVMQVDVQNLGPTGDWFAEGDGPGGPGEREYQWTARVAGWHERRRWEGTGRLVHARRDGAPALVAAAVTAAHDAWKEARP